MTAAPMRVGVAGLGLIGGSVLQRLAGTPDRFSASGFDAEPVVGAAARDAGLPVAASLEALAGASDVVVVAVPPAATADTVLAVLSASPSVLVTDTASVKGGVLNAVAAAAGSALGRYLPGHPLAGSVAAGWAAARAEMLDGAAWALCPPVADAPPDALVAVAAVLDAFDARIVVCDAAEHDAAVALTSHAPHVLAEVVAAAAAPGARAGLGALLSGGALRDMTRVAGADARLWLQIIAANRAATVTALDAWLDHTRRIRDALADGDDGPLAQAWADGARARAAIDAVRWREPAWEPCTLTWPAWAALLDLGRAGRAVRRLRLDGAALHLDAAAAPAPA